MKVIQLSSLNFGRVRFRVYGKDKLPFPAINDYLIFLENKDNAPNTIKSYAYDLIKYFEFLEKIGKQWMSIGLTDWVDFIQYLKYSTSDTSLSVLPVNFVQVRTGSSINRSLTSVNSYYKFQYAKNKIEIPNIEEILSNPYTNSYKSFLSFAQRSRPKSVRNAVKPLGRQKQTSSKPVEIPLNIQTEMVSYCSNRRDKMLLLLLIETGFRIGQALGLRHEDIISYEKKISVVYRINNANGMYAKSQTEYQVDISSQWLDLYTDYLITDYNEIDSDYVFTSLYSSNGPKDKPLTYPAVNDLFKRLSKKTGVNVRAHMLRHTHATDLIRAGLPIEMVAKRLGHKSIETTKTIYEHLTSEDIKNELKKHASRNHFLRSLYSFEKEIVA